MADEPSFREHRVPTEQGALYVRDYDGAGPPFVLMHGFPDNLHIYDELIPYLVRGGRRVIAFDFLGFGASEKPPGAVHSFAQQLDDLRAVVGALDLDQIVLVPHDSSGIVGVNFAVEHADKVHSLCILNSAYDDTPLNVWPEMIVLFADPSLRALAGAFLHSPEQFGWLLNWQGTRFSARQPAEQQAHFRAVIQPLIAENFITQPSSAPAFAQMTAGFYEELRRNSARLPLVRSLETPVKVVWGEHDPYLGVELGKDRASLFRNGSFRPVPAGHWLQSDQPELVARELLS